jgi:hypothetical protein
MGCGVARHGNEWQAGALGRVRPQEFISKFLREDVADSKFIGSDTQDGTRRS